MSFESYKKIYDDGDIYLKIGKPYTFTFDGNELENAERLFFTGETAIFYQWKDEPDYQILYRQLDDSLNTEYSRKNQYCLDFSANDHSYPKIAFRKTLTPFKMSYLKLITFTDTWQMGISVKAEGLEIKEGGYLRMVVEIRLKKDGIDPHYIGNEPDNVFVIDIPEGSYDWQELTKEVCFDAENTASVCFLVEGIHYSGKVYFEEPLFVGSDGHNILPPFSTYTADRSQFNWIGQNLSRKEWPAFNIMLNGKCIFDGETFERCHRYAESEISFEKGSIRDGSNELTFTFTSDYNGASVYRLHEVGFVSTKESHIIACPENIVCNKPFSILIKGKHGNAVEFKSEKLQLLSPAFLEKDGLNALSLICKTPCTDIHFTLNGEDHIISRCAEKGDDGVITGTGDLIYINADIRDFENYISWYLSNGIGNLLTIRPAYRWSGTRELDDRLWEDTTELLDKMGVKYAHMVDGRELPGCDVNPRVEIIDTQSFLGRQTHEIDGQLCYWGIWEVTNDYNTEMYYDMLLRMSQRNPDTFNIRFHPANMFYEEGRRILFRDITVPEDMEAAANFFVSQANKTRFGCPRHTGPTTMFKYFYQAGYTWTGAELMYSPTELTASALRGASKLYGGKTGSHLAVQWSTSPHDTEARYKRYRLALFICYIQGIDEINTEEGLWRLEEYYYYHHRFSPACLNHLKQQQDFYRYISTHTRSGEFYTPIAFLSGRFDGWRCFSRGRNTWGKQSFGFSDAEKSWDILTYFYPRSVLDSIYIHDCAKESKGYYTGTPYGNVDIVPIERDEYSKYRLLIASGYNKALSEDMEKLLKYVSDGGILVIGWPELSVTTKRTDVVELRHKYIEHEFVNAAAQPDPVFTEDTFQGLPVTVNENYKDENIIIYTDSGRPLVYKRDIGNGSVYFVNAKEYAGADSVALAYKQVFDRVVPLCLSRECCYAKGSENIQFAVYDNGNKSKNVYFIATDWYSECGDGNGILTVGEHFYDVRVPFGQLVKVAVAYERAVYPENDCNEVISFDGNIAKVQGVGKAVFNILSDGETKAVTVDFNDCSVKEIKLK